MAVISPVQGCVRVCGASLIRPECDVILIFAVWVAEQRGGRIRCDEISSI